MDYAIHFLIWKRHFSFGLFWWLLNGLNWQNRRAILGDSIYKSITLDYFDPDEFLLTVDLSNEHKILDLKNRIEASTVIRRRKTSSTKDSNSHWGSPMSPARKELFEERAKSVLIILKQRFPGISQSTLDISKIQYNRVWSFYKLLSSFLYGGIGYSHCTSKWIMGHRLTANGLSDISNGKIYSKPIFCPWYIELLHFLMNLTAEYSFFSSHLCRTWDMLFWRATQE